MYRVVVKTKTDYSSWKGESSWEFETKDGAELGFNTAKITLTVGEYAEKYDSEVLLDSPTALCYHSKLKNDNSWSGITRLVYLEEVS